MKGHARPKKSSLARTNRAENMTRQLVTGLRPQEQRIIRMRFGIDSEVYEIREIAQLLGISEAEIDTAAAKFLKGFRKTGPT
jgi:DNA-directed RNA polymerase sigma subunit (sigma70/sigma32)